MIFVNGSYCVILLVTVLLVDFENVQSFDRVLCCMSKFQVACSGSTVCDHYPYPSNVNDPMPDATGSRSQLSYPPLVHIVNNN